MKTKFSRILIWICFSVLTLSLSAEAPSGYYSDVEGKNKAELKTAFHQIIKEPKVGSYASLWTSFQSTDKKPDGTVWDMYTDIPDGTPNGKPKFIFNFGQNQCGNYKNEGDCYNREHSFPKSWFSDAEPMHNDLFHLYPTDGKVNGMRSNWAYGNVGIESYKSSNGSKVGKGAMNGYTETVFEPIDEYKGDFARTYFHMITCYEDRISNWKSPHLNKTKYPGFNQWSIDLLLEWSREDPVSQKEIDRNDAVYKIQNNRNPFIDFPGLEEYIWGSSMDKPFNPGNLGNTDPRVKSDVGALNFTTNKLNVATTQNIKINAYYLSGNLTVTLIGDNEFTTGITQISKTDAEAGYLIPVSYTPGGYCTNNAALNISGGGLASTYTIELTGVTEQAFSENLLDAPFKTGFDGFTQINMVGTMNSWKVDATNGYVKMSGFVGGKNYEHEAWLISPSINLTNKKDIILSFDHTGKMFDGLATMKNDLTLWISGNHASGKPISGEWTQIAIPAYMTGGDWTFVSSGNIDLAQFKSMSEAHIAFKFVSTNTYSGNWEIKNVVVKATDDINSINDKKEDDNIRLSLIPGGIDITINSNITSDIELYDIYGRLITKQKALFGDNLIAVNSPQFVIVKIGSFVKKIVTK